MNPYDLTAGPFLALYLTAMAVCLALGLWLRSAERNDRAPGCVNGLDPVGWAYLSAGAARALDTAVVGLMQAGDVILDAQDKALVPSHPVASAPAYLSRFKSLLTVETSLAALPKRMEPVLDGIAKDLVARGLAWGEADRERRGLVSSAPLIVLGVCGVVRIGLGSARHHPVGYIFALTLLTFVAGILLAANAPFVRQAGREALDIQHQATHRLRRAPDEGELLLALALSGGAVLAMTPYAVFAKLRAPSRADGGGGSGGCGGGGGGCGGGGCGGCGG